jgi:ABC-type nickel/cobalt efflux system permease component RcnA
MRAGSGPAALRGGIAEVPSQITDIIQARDLTLPAILVSLVVAAGVGAVHAASPGHGKTLMAAYLVGTRGTVRHALALGLTVTVSHTIGVLILGGIVLFAGAVIPSERLFPILGLTSGLIVTVLGLGLLRERVREHRERLSAHDAHDQPHDLDHDHAHDGGDAHTHGHDHTHSDEGPAGGWHSHGLVRHTHLPPGDDAVRWRNIVALGLVGGLVPSASAILILVGSIAAGRPAYGMVLTLAFGIGMAVVLVGVGVLLVRARGVIERWPRADHLGTLFARLPVITALVFVVAGAVITVQAGMQLQ